MAVEKLRDQDFLNFIANKGVRIPKDENFYDPNKFNGFYEYLDEEKERQVQQIKRNYYRNLFVGSFLSGFVIFGALTIKSKLKQLFIAGYSLYFTTLICNQLVIRDVQKAGIYEYYIAHSDFEKKVNEIYGAIQAQKFHEGIREIKNA